MPKKAAGGGDAEQVVEAGSVPPPRVASGQLTAFNTELPLPSQASQGSAAFQDPEPFQNPPPYQESAEDLVASSFAKAPAFTPPRLLSEVSFDDAVASQSPPPSALAPPPMPGFPGAGGAGMTSPGSQVASAAGMGISITGAPGMVVPPKQTPAQMSATNQALRIRLLRADGKPFDGPEITTGPKKNAQKEAQKDAQTPSRTEFDKPRGAKIQKQAPKVVVKTGPLERAGHTLAVLLISAVGIVPLAYLLLQSVHDREDKLAAKITAPTKMNVLDGSSEAYLAGMAVVLLAVTVLYAMRLKRRRER
jgi:hypothetical protein